MHYNLVYTNVKIIGEFNLQMQPEFTIRLAG